MMKNRTETLQKIRKFLQTNFVIAAKKKELLAKNLEKFSNKKLLRLLQVLEKISEKEIYFVRKAMKKNPNLLEKIQNFYRNIKKTERLEKENIDLNKEQKEIEVLESQFSEIFTNFQK
ncbi:hypothetical protein HOA64_00650 [bacterium]|jgi:hypothetical protein|nr:hypothetical protein [bacterium]MBT6831549.1 hypothetical protein [bacterium]